MNENVRDAYFQWLCDLVNRRGGDKASKELEALLFNTEFVALVPNDDNRAKDGLELRNEYFSLTGNESVLELPDPCNILEMLIALARHVDYCVQRPGENDQCSRWFWKLVNNIGLENFYCDDPQADEKNRLNSRLLKCLVERSYNSNGTGGGLFPLRRAREDQRRVELWYQMQSYLGEIYKFD